jgi:aspartyl-tRNA(Asn)/glutamyl-tRNA(Gln) amidotransferase subunit C
MSISRADVEYVAGLAHLALSDEEIADMVRSLNAVLEYVKCLEAVDTEGVDPAEDTGATGTPLRPDTAGPGFPEGRATGSAPLSENGLFKVPPAFGDE